MISLEKRDILRFVLYFILFSGLLVMSEKVFSPENTSFYDSSSIKNREELVDDTFFSGTIPSSDTTIPKKAESSGSINTASVTEVTPEAPKKTQTPGRLTFSFQPDSISLDTKIVDLIRANTDCSYLKDKLPSLAITVNGDITEPRGQTSGNRLTISTNMASDSETIKVFVHELGHIIDIQYLKKGAFRNDPSEEFYTLSWDGSSVKKPGAKLADFVSGYALSSKYEDFAESFTFFVFHNSEFANRAKSNTILSAKYRFFQDQVFENSEFKDVSFESQKIPKYLWDSTKISVDTKKYLFYIK